MSGSGIPSDIPIQVSTGDSPSQVSALERRFQALNSEVRKLADSFQKLGVGREQITGINQALRTMQSLLATPSAQVGLLGASRTGGNRIVQAAQELGIQQSLANPTRVGSSLLGGDQAGIRNARKAQERVIAELRLREAELTRRLEDLNTALATAPSFGRGSRGAGGASAIRRQIGQVQADQQALPRLIQEAEEGARRLDARLTAQRLADASLSRLQARQWRFYEREAYAQTPEGISEVAIREGERVRRQAQRELERARRRAQDDAERAANAVPDAIARQRTNTQAQASILRAPGARSELVSVLGERAAANLDAIVQQATSNPDFLTRLRERGIINARVNQSIAQALQSDTGYQAAADTLDMSRRRDRLRRNQTAFADTDLRTQEDTLTRYRNYDRAFGDGGGAIFATQARLMLNYAMLNQAHNTFIAAATAVADLDNALKNLQAISASTNGEMEKLSKTIMNVSLGTRFSAVELTQAATMMAQAGLGVQEIESGLRAVALMATATGSELKTAVDIATTALSVFRMRAEELPRVADQMTAALNLSKLTIEQVALGFQYVANTAADAGLSFSETTAALATLANQGIRSGSTLGTGFRQLLVDLQQPNENLQRRMRELGLTMNDVDVRAHGLAGVFGNLRRAGFTSADAFATIELRAAAAFSAFSRGAQDMQELQQGLLSANGAAQANAVQMESLINRFLQLRNTMIALATEALRPLMDLLKSLVSGLNEVLLSATGATTALQVLGGALTALAVGAAVRMVVTLTSSLIAMRAALAGAAAGTIALGTAIRAVPIIGWVATLGTAVAMLVDFGGAQARATAEVERGRQRFNEAQAEYTRARTALQSLDEFMNNVVARSSALNANQELLNTTVAEARNRFRDLSGAVQNNITTYGDLIGVLQQVRRELTATMFLQARAAAVASADRVRQLETTAQPPLRTEDWATLAGIFGGTRGAERFQLAALAERNRDPNRPETERSQAAFRRVLPPGIAANPEMSAALAVLEQMGSLPPNAVEPASRTLAQAIALLSTPAGDSLGLPPDQRRRMIEYLEGRTRLLGELFTARSQNNIQQRAFQVSGFSQSREAATMNTETTRLNEMVTQQLEAIAREPILENRRGMLGRLRTSAQGAVDTLYNLADTPSQFNAANPDGQTVGREYLENNPIFQQILGRLQSAGVELERRIVVATGERAEAAQSAAERRVQAAVAAGRGLRDPAQAERQGILAEEAVRRAGEIELERLQARRREEEQREPRDPVTRAALDTSDREGVRARVEQRVLEVRRQATETAAAAIEVDLQGLQEDLRRLTQRGRQRNDPEINRIRDQAQQRITQIGRMRGESQAMIDARIARFNSGQDRADFTQNRGGGYRASTDPARQRDANYDRRLGNIEYAARTDTYNANAEVREIQAELDAARRVPNRFSQGYLIRLEERLNEAEQRAQVAVQESQRRRVQALENLRGLASGDLNDAQAALRAAGGENAPLTERNQGLRRDVESLSATIERIDEMIRQAQSVSQNATAIIRARSRENVGSIGESLEDARSQIRRDYALDESPYKTFTSSIVNVFGDATKATSDFFMNFVTGSKRSSDAARDMAVSILQSVGRLATNRLTAMVLDFGLKTIAGAFSPGAGSIPTDTPGVAPDLAPSRPFSLYNGGIVPYRFARGTSRVPGPDFGRDTVPAYLAGGEAVLNRRAASLLGEETISELNAGRVRATNAVASVALPKREPDNVSVYVMAPNEKPSLGPKDVLMVIGQDVLTGGQTKQLIKQVAVGAI